MEQKLPFFLMIFQWFNMQRQHPINYRRPWQRGMTPSPLGIARACPLHLYLDANLGGTLLIVKFYSLTPGTWLSILFQNSSSDDMASSSITAFCGRQAFAYHMNDFWKRYCFFWNADTLWAMVHKLANWRVSFVGALPWFSNDSFNAALSFS